MLKAALNRGFCADRVSSDNAWRKVKPHDQRIYVLPDVFLSQPRNDFLFGRSAATQHSAKSHNPKKRIKTSSAPQTRQYQSAQPNREINRYPDEAAIEVNFRAILAAAHSAVRSACHRRRRVPALSGADRAQRRDRARDGA